MNNFENMPDSEAVLAFRQMTDDVLHNAAIKTAAKERKTTLLLIRQLNEIDRRHLYSKFSVDSLHGYCVKELKMDDATAGRRVSASRLLRDMPALEEKILSGAVSLTSVAQAGVFFRKEAKNGKAFSNEEKNDLILELENKSTREVDKILISKSENPEIHLKEKISQKTETKTVATLYFDEETMAALNRLQEIWSHALPNASLAEVIKRAALEAVDKHDPLKKGSREKPKPNPAPESAPKQNPAPERPPSKAEIKRQIWKRDQAQCTFKDPRTNERCKAKHFVQEDHIIPEAMGGEYSLENIRLRCRAHNQRHAINCFGKEKMKEHLRSMR